jgi:hypothetical protein
VRTHDRVDVTATNPAIKDPPGWPLRRSTCVNGIVATARATTSGILSQIVSGLFVQYRRRLDFTFAPFSGVFNTGSVFTKTIAASRPDHQA